MADLNRNVFYIGSPSNILGLLSNNYAFYKKEQTDFQESNLNIEGKNDIVKANKTNLQYISVMHYVCARQLRDPLFSENDTVDPFTEFSKYIARDFMYAGHEFLNSLITMGENNINYKTFERNGGVQAYLEKTNVANVSLFEYVIDNLNNRVYELMTIPTENDKLKKLGEYITTDDTFLKNNKYRDYSFYTLKDNNFFGSKRTRFPKVIVKGTEYQNIGTFILLKVRGGLNVVPIPKEDLESGFNLAKLYDEIKQMARKFTTIGLTSKFTRMSNSDVFKFALETIPKEIKYIKNDYERTQKFLNEVLDTVVSESDKMMNGFWTNLMAEKVSSIGGSAMRNRKYNDYVRIHNIRVLDFMRLDKIGSSVDKSPVLYTECLRCVDVACEDNSLLKRLVDQRYVETARIKNILDGIMEFPTSDMEVYIKVYKSFSNGNGIGHEVVSTKPAEREVVIRVFVISNPLAQMYIKFTRNDFYNPVDKNFNRRIPTSTSGNVENATLKSIILFQYLCFKLTEDSTLFDMLTNHTVHFMDIGNVNYNYNTDYNNFKRMETNAIDNVNKQITKFANGFKYTMKPDITDRLLESKSKQIVYALITTTTTNINNPLFDKHLKENTQFVYIRIQDFSRYYPKETDGCGCGAKSEEPVSSKNSAFSSEIKLPKFKLT
jgi:hypothetical protein